MGKVALIYASFGEGHRIASLSLKEFLSAPCYDLLSFCPSFIKRIYSRSYTVITERSPFFWKLLFYSAKSKIVSALIEKIHRVIFGSLYQCLQEGGFETIIITHFFPLQLIASVKEKLNLKIITIITDFKVHPLWLNRAVDFYFVALEETRQDLVRLGVEQNKILAGVPLREGFIRSSAVDLRKRFSLDEKPCLLFVSSLRGNFPFFKEVFPSLLDKFNIFVIYGKNKALKEYLSRFGSNSLRMFASYDQIWELITLSSIVITKPGGLTVFEGAYKKKFFIFTHYIPGQEKENMDLLIKYGVARYAANKDDFMAALKYFQEDKDKLSLNYPLQLKNIRDTLSSLI